MLKRFTRKIFGGGPSSKSTEGFFLHVRCTACGEVFKLFVHKTTELVQNFDKKGRVTYTLKKEIIGARCRNMIHVKMEFDAARNLISRQIENGQFIDNSES